MRTPTYLNRYRLVTDGLGEPVMLRRCNAAVTYQAEDIESGREVAMEVFPAPGLEQEMREELEREAMAARELNHINIPALHAFGAEGDQLVYASEYFDGSSAEAWVKTHGAMPPGPVLRIALQVVNALGAAACHGIVHPAINPRNVILVPGQTAKGDWPLVKILNLIGPAPIFASSPADAEFASKFMSPEQLEKGTVDFQSEMYSLGATLWFLVTGVAPESGAVFPRVSGLPKPVLQLLGQMLWPNPEERPGDPLACEEEIRACLERLERREAVGRKLGVSRPAAVSGESKPYRSITWRPFAVAALFLALATLGALLVTDNLPWPRGDVATVENAKPIGVPVVSPPVGAPAPLPISSAAPKIVAKELSKEAAPVVIPNNATSAQLAAEELEIVAAAMKEPPPPTEGLALSHALVPAEVAGHAEAQLPVSAAASPTPRVLQLHRVLPAPAEQPVAPVERAAKAEKRLKRINGLEVRPAEPVEVNAPPSP